MKEFAYIFCIARKSLKIGFIEGDLEIFRLRMQEI
jgi:hypothetical protein